MSNPTPSDLALAAQLSDHLTLGMHHATPDGRAAIAAIIAAHRARHWPAHEGFMAFEPIPLDMSRNPTILSTSQ